MRVPWILKNIYLFKNWRELYAGSVSLRLRNGVRMRVNSKHDVPILWHVMGAQCYGDFSDLPERPIIIDIGANIGSFTLWALNRRPRARVLSFEPMSKNFELLSENVSANGFHDGVTLNKKGVAGMRGESELYISLGGDSGHHTIVPLPKRMKNFARETERIECITLDEILEPFEKVDMVKIDVEGAEVGIVKASTQLHKIRKIVAEAPIEAIRPVLEKSGFRVSETKNQLVVAVRE